jgi:hypothetical protein
MAALFFVLTPGVLLSLPRKGSKLMVAATHALVFAVAFYFLHDMILNFTVSMDGFAVTQSEIQPHLNNKLDNCTNILDVTSKAPGIISNLKNEMAAAKTAKDTKKQMAVNNLLSPLMLKNNAAMTAKRTMAC